MSIRSRFQRNRRAKKPSSRQDAGGAELPRTPFWKWALMIATLVAIPASIAQTTIWISDVIAGFPTPLPFTKEAPGESLILVAEFDRATGIPDPRASEKIGNAIRGAVDALKLANVRVEMLQEVIPINASDKAEDVGKLFNATTVIWGEETSVDVKVNLLNRRRVLVARQSNIGDGQVSSSFSYVQPDNTEEIATRVDSPLPGPPNNPDLPLLYSPLPIAPNNVVVSRTEGTYVTTNTDWRQYSHLITVDLPGEITFFALLPLAQMQVFDGNEQLGLELLEKALAARSSTQSTGDDIGEIYREVARLHLSLAHHQPVLFSNGQIYADEGQQAALYKHGQIAKERLDQALEAGLTEPLTYYLLGSAYYFMGDFKEALRALDTAMELKPDENMQIFVLYDRAYAKKELGNKDGALADIATLLNMDPELSGAYILRAMILYQAGDYQGAIADADKAVEVLGVTRKIPQLVILKAQSYIGLEEYGKALDTIQELIDEAGPGMKPENRAYFEALRQEVRALMDQ